MKQCTKCKIEKEDSEFYRDKYKKDGLTSQCKACQKEHSDLHKDRKKETNRKWRENNPEKHKAHRKKASKKWRKNHPEEYKKTHKIWVDNNKEKIRVSSQKSIYSLTEYLPYFEKLSQYEECRKDPNNEELLQVRCKTCNKWININRSKAHSRLQCINGTCVGNSYFFCSIECKDKFVLKLSNKDYVEYLKYRRKADAYALRMYRRYKYLINSLDLLRGQGKDKYHIDHIFSVLDGFKNQVPIEVISNPYNLRMFLGSKNIAKLAKLDKSDIKLEELYINYNLFLEKLNAHTL